MKHKILTGLFLLLCITLFSACGSTPSTTAAAVPTVAPTVPPAPAGYTTVHVQLANIKIQSTLTKFSVGTPYYFVISNEDKVEHEFMISPASMGGHISASAMSNVSFALVEHIAPGTTTTLKYTFKYPALPGYTEFACHYGDHYAKGMMLPIEIVK